jgi:hypothetical protein
LHISETPKVKKLGEAAEVGELHGMDLTDNIGMIRVLWVSSLEQAGLSASSVSAHASYFNE